MTDEAERLKKLSTAVLSADRGHMEHYQLLRGLVPILRPTEPELALGVEILAEALKERCMALLAVTIEVTKEASV